MRASLFVPVAILVAIANPVSAGHCVTWSTSVTNDEMIVLDLDEYGFGYRYVVNDLCNVPYASTEPSVIRVWFGHEFARVPVPFTAGVECVYSVWIYEETNGIPGLQRGDEVVDDSCHGQIEPDQFVW